MRPTRKAVLLFSLSVPLALLLASLWGEARYFLRLALCYPGAALAVILADAAGAFPAGRLKAALRAPLYLYAGQAGTIEISLTAEGRPSSGPAVQLLLELTGEADTPGILSAEITGGQLAVSVPIVPRRRGRVTVDALWLRWRGPLGLTERTVRRQDGSVTDVVPDVKGIHEAALQFFSRDAVYGVKTQRLKGEGTEFESLTEYAAGMDSRTIDWKRSAAHRKLLCKEYRQERNHQIVLGFDTGHLMLEPIDEAPKLDHAIKAGLLLSWIGLRGGDLAGGCGFGARFRGFIRPGRGMQYFTRIQRFTAGLEYSTEETNFTLGLAELNSRLQRRALVVIFSEFADVISAELLLESLQLMAKRHAVIFVTLRAPMLPRMQSAPPKDFRGAAEAVIADDFLRERSIVLERAARLGVHCIDVPAQMVSSALINRYLMIKRRGLL